MSNFCYLVTEGVHDVAFLGKLLGVVFGAKRIKKLEELPEPFQRWLKSFTWPRFTGKHHDIERLAVPAPEFHQLPSSDIVILRNAQGITEIHKTMFLDGEAFDRLQLRPDAVGIVLDSDEKASADRFADITTKLRDLNLPMPPTLGAVISTVPRTGVFSLPEPGAPGTLEDLLLPLGKSAYADLHADALAFAETWKKKADGDPTSADWKELRKPAGIKKATLGAMTAILKPGKAIQQSLSDNRWLHAQARDIDCLKPCIEFLDRLLMIAPTPPRDALYAVSTSSP